MSSIGSVFLGDNTRHRLLSSPSSSPPSSSPPPSSISAVFPPSLSQSPPTSLNINSQSEAQPQESKQPKVPIDPLLALDLRLRWLEAILNGVGVGAAAPSSKSALKPTEGTPGQTSTISRAAHDLHRKFNAIVASNDGLRRFIAQYDQHSHLLTPTFALSDPTSESHTMSVAQFEALLTEMEPDIRAAERDLQEIEMLEKKGVIGAGKLEAYEELQPRLDELLALHQENTEMAAKLEERIAALVERHATQVDTLSDLFVAWDDTMTELDDKLTQLEKERNERRRLGLEQ